MIKKAKRDESSDADTGEEDPNANFYDIDDPFINDTEVDLGDEI